ncbi:hypothetical protein [Sedimentibacter sp. B4]|uniref:hypothetical protein n=1 Tax=Sedimentibacter sp. B4 TaxID=304766 RepID=UPI00031DF98A|nr:hypothetical protein [Sedimentibacter sp. B4]
MSDNNFINKTNKYKHRIYRAKNILKSTLNNQPLNSSEIILSEFSMQNQIENGALSVGVFTACQALPVKNAEVTVYDILEDGTEHIHARSITDENGRIPDVVLPVQHDSQNLYGRPKYPFTTYNIRVTSDNFYTVNIINFRIFPNVKTSYSINMHPIIPGETVHIPEETLEIPSSIIDGSNF